MNASRKFNQSGFTVIELVVVAVILAIAGFLVFNQTANIRIANEDSQRKTAINAMYYSLEEVYFKQNGSYPSTITADTLPSVEPGLFTDPDGFTLGKEALSDDELQQLVDSGDADDDVIKRFEAVTSGKSPNYHYDATECDMDGKCKSYTLRADLVAEAEYVKKSRN